MQYHRTTRRDFFTGLLGALCALPLARRTTAALSAELTPPPVPPARSPFAVDYGGLTEVYSYDIKSDTMNDVGESTTYVYDRAGNLVAVRESFGGGKSVSQETSEGRTGFS